MLIAADSSPEPDAGDWIIRCLACGARNVIVSVLKLVGWREYPSLKDILNGKEQLLDALAHVGCDVAGQDGGVSLLFLFRSQLRGHRVEWKCSGCEGLKFLDVGSRGVLPLSQGTDHDEALPASSGIAVRWKEGAGNPAGALRHAVAEQARNANG